MRTRLLLRLSLIGVCVVHGVILLSLLYPSQLQGGILQTFFASLSEPSVRANLLPNIEGFLLVLFLPLILPPLVLWMTFKFPTGIISLSGLWVSVGILLVPCVFLYAYYWSDFTSALYDNPSLALKSMDLIPFILLSGFTFTLLLCFSLAIALPIVRAYGQSHPRMGLEAEPASRREEGGHDRNVRMRRPHQKGAVCLFSYHFWRCSVSWLTW